MYKKDDHILSSDVGNVNIAQFIRLNNRLRANGFLSIPFLPDIVSPARSPLYGSNNEARKSILVGSVVNDYRSSQVENRAKTSNSDSDDKYLMGVNERRTDDMSQTLISSSHGLNIARTPEIPSNNAGTNIGNDYINSNPNLIVSKVQNNTSTNTNGNGANNSVNDDLINDIVLTPGVQKYRNDVSEYSELNSNTEDYRTVGSILHNIYNEGILNMENKQKRAGLGLSSVIDDKVSVAYSQPIQTEYYRNEVNDMFGDESCNAIELSFPIDENTCVKLPPQAVSEPQKLVVDGKKLISTIHNLLYELESRGEHSVEALNIERSQKNGLIEKLSLLKRKYDALEKENESLRAINKSLSEDEYNFKYRNLDKDKKLTITKLEREKQQLLVENCRLKQDILRLQEDDDKSRDKADQFLKQIKNDLENEKESNNNCSGRLGGFNLGINSINLGSGSGVTLTQSEKKKLLQSHYIYSIIVGFEKSILFWKNKFSLKKESVDAGNNNQDEFKVGKNTSADSIEITNKKEETLTDKSIFSYCQENNISSSELMKRDKLLWSRGLYLLQNTDRTELESIIRWSCRLLNVSNFRSIPIMIGSLLSSSKKKSLYTFESSNQTDILSSSSINTLNNHSKKKAYGNDCNNTNRSNCEVLKQQEEINSELYDRFYNHFKTLFDVLDDQDVIQASNSIYIQLRDFKKFFRVVCDAFNLDYKTTTISECIKIFNDFMSINMLSSKKMSSQPQIMLRPLQHRHEHHDDNNISSSSSSSDRNANNSSKSNAKHIIESLKIVLDVDSEEQILPTLKQHLESQSAIIMSLSKNQRQ
ncbi:hypothetical protein FG386_000921 [Cryptosporidium ryanae]|uniref:uncharacterized protein n=1 Tax=Cryptosporidium ryanae TaxID=515981 RepID=UPI00351AA352|nr:hypothetical protein FG386_000921 [Cryptosporidium ryanae]